MNTPHEIARMKLGELGNLYGIMIASCEGRVSRVEIKVAKIDPVRREREKTRREVEAHIGERRIFDWETPLRIDKVTNSVVCKHNAFYFNKMEDKAALKANQPATMAVVHRLAMFSARDVTLAYAENARG